MTMDEREQLAVDYVLGVLGHDARMTVESQAAVDPVLRTLIDDWAAQLAPLAAGIPPMTPPEDAYQKISDRIGQSAAPPVGTRTVRASQADWLEIAPGLKMKLLLRDVAAGRQTMLLTIAPGAAYAGHEHDHPEEMYVLTGDLQFGDFELGPGDYHFAPPGGSHPPAVSRAGCTALVVTAP